MNELLDKKIMKIHNYIYANDGLSNAETLSELLKIIYCKMSREKKGLEFNTLLEMKILVKQVHMEINDLIQKFPNIFDDKILLKDTTIFFIIKELESINFQELKSDKKGHILQKILDRSYRERNGQFFTPHPVVDFMVKMIEPKSFEKGGDPASGTGGFMFSSIDYITKNDIPNLEKIYFYEISEKIAKLISMRFLFEFDFAKPNVIVGDSLENGIGGNFDYILSNPPFGSKGRISNKNLLSKYELGYNEKGKIMNNQVPDILFIEKIIKSLKNGGRAGIVLPDGNFENPSSIYIRKYIINNCKIDAIISLPDGTFIPYGTGVKSSLLFITKYNLNKVEALNNKGYNVFFSKITKLGYTFSKHSKTAYTNSGEIDQDYEQVLIDFKRKKENNISHFVNIKEIILNYNLSYRFYNKEYNGIIKSILSKKHVLLGEVCNIITNKEKKKLEQTYRYVEIADVNPYASEIINSSEIIGEELPGRASYIINENDVIVAIAGNSIGTRKHSKAIVNSEYEGSICTNGFAVLKCKNVSPYYILHFLNTDEFLKQVLKYKYGSAIPSMNREDLKKIVIPIYDDDIMNKIIKNVKKSYELREYANRLINTTY